ncbi:MAG: hypothetical protein APF84_18690 [Gracilibacter sp. BRH_c7a]|nr:MAG: hypothetical protein APF84_18690 [Gracilibacter sp. BRH_c7a]
MDINTCNLRNIGSRNTMLRKYVIILMVIFTLIFTFSGQVLAASEPELDFLEFQTEDDQNFLIGETANIKVILFDEDDDLFSGSVTAYISGPDGEILGYYSVGGGGGYYTVSNVILDYEGDYGIHIRDSEFNYASGTITVTKPLISIAGDLAQNRKTELRGKLTDVDGKALPRKSITVDGTDVGLENSQNYTTSYDGTFSFWITPSEEGDLKILFSGHEIGALRVGPPYSQGGRIGGGARNNVELSVSVAQEGWTSADTVILTRDDNLADALSSVPLSRMHNAPILMTPSDRLDDQISYEIRNLEVMNVIIIGGEGAISKSIETDLRNSGYSVERIAGADRYETAAKIASKFPSTKTVYLAYGYGEPDALAASSFAALNSIPILLTDKTGIPEVTRTQLQRLNPTEVMLLGGNGVIDPKVENDLKKNYLVERWAGADRYETEWAILRNLFTDQSKLYFSSALVSARDVSSGKPYGDALLAASLAAKNDAIAINIPPNYLPKAIEYFLTYNRGYISEARIIGNTSAISSILEKQIEKLLTR